VQPSRRQQAKKRSNSLYRELPSGKSTPDEETLFIGGLGTVRISPLGACYPDLHNHLLAMTKTRSIVGWLAWMPLACAVAAQPDPRYTLIDTEKSPGRTFQIEYYENTNHSTAQIWTAAKGRRTNKSLLFEYGDPEGVTVLVSADDKWLVLNHRAGSDLTHPILFRKVSDGRFEKTKDINLEDVVWSTAATNQGFTTKTIFDHSYSEALCWLGDSHSLVLRAWGYYSGEYGLDHWYCIYSVDTKKVTFDLSALNKRAFQIVKHDQKANQAVQRTGASRSGELTNGASSAAGSRR